MRFRLADFAEILGQLRLQVQQLLPLGQVDLQVRCAVGPGRRLYERATLQVQVFEDFRELGRLAWAESRRQVGRGRYVQRAVQNVGGAPAQLEIGGVRIQVTRRLRRI